MVTTYRLILVTGTGAGTEYPLEKTELQLGRELSNDIVINDAEVSRRHARLVLQEEGYVLEDLGSTNGTFIRGQRLAAPVVLRPGETITIGEKVTLKYEVFSPDQSATVVVQRRGPVSVQPANVPPPAVVPPQSASIAPPAPVVAGRGATPAKKKSKALVIILILLAVIVVFCVIPLVIIDATRSWCSPFLGGLLNFIFGAGTC